jgi:hypothetical protein
MGPRAKRIRVYVGIANPTLPETVDSWRVETSSTTPQTIKADTVDDSEHVRSAFFRPNWFWPGLRRNVVGSARAAEVSRQLIHDRTFSNRDVLFILLLYEIKYFGKENTIGIIGQRYLTSQADAIY